MAQLMQKLNITNGLIAKLRHQVSSSSLKTIYFALFDSHLHYTAQVWHQRSSNVVDMVKRTWNKAEQIISFKDRTEPSDPLYANHKILKLQISLHWTIACLSKINYVITFQMLSQIISNFLKISSHNTRGSNLTHTPSQKNKPCLNRVRPRFCNC